MSKIHGLSLIELLVCVALLGILSLLCLPLGVALYQKNQLQVREKEVFFALQYARNMALLQGIPLILTPLSDSTDWSQGMILSIDNKEHKYHIGDNFLQQWYWPRQDIKLSWHGFHSNHYLLFAAELKHMAASGHFLIQNEHYQSIKMVVNRFGRVSRQERL